MTTLDACPPLRCPLVLIVVLFLRPSPLERLQKVPALRRGALFLINSLSKLATLGVPT